MRRQQSSNSDDLNRRRQSLRRSLRRPPPSWEALLQQQRQQQPQQQQGQMAQQPQEQSQQPAAEGQPEPPPPILEQLYPGVRRRASIDYGRFARRAPGNVLRRLRALDAHESSFDDTTNGSQENDAPTDVVIGNVSSQPQPTLRRASRPAALVLPGSQQQQQPAGIQQQGTGLPNQQNGIQRQQQSNLLTADLGVAVTPPRTPIRRLMQQAVDPAKLAPPSAVGLTQMEAPPKIMVQNPWMQVVSKAMEQNRSIKKTMEKIPTRVRSQSWLIRTRHLLDDDKIQNRQPIISKCLLLLSVFLLIITFPFCLPFCVRIAKEYNRAVVFRLGRLIKRGTKGPGIFFILPCIDTYKMIDLRVLSFDVPSQEILSRDSVTVSVEAVIYFRISNPVVSVTNVNDAQFSTRLLAQTTLRNVLGTKTLSEILMERDVIATVLEKVLDEGTEPWGVKVERVEIKDIRLPHQLMKSMAAEAEAARDARAKVIAADGERNASRQLVQAADVMSGNKVSLHLRFLQTLVRISIHHNHTYVVPIPVEVVKRMMQRLKKRTC